MEISFLLRTGNRLYRRLGGTWRDAICSHCQKGPAMMVWEPLVLYNTIFQTVRAYNCPFKHHSIQGFHKFTDILICESQL